jgi:hypothetical protein
VDRITGRRRRFGGDRGATQLAALVIVGGVGLGAMTAGFVSERAFGSGDGEVATGTVRATIITYDCEGEFPTGAVQGGDRVFITGLSDGDETRLRIRNPTQPDETWWMDADQVDADSDLGELVTVPCDGPVADETVDEESGDEVAAGEPTTTASPGTETAETTPATVIIQTPQGPQVVPLSPSPDVTISGGSGTSPSPAPSPSPPGPTPPPPTPTPVPPSPGPAPPPADTAGPTLSATVSPAEIWEQHAGLCAGKDRQATISANVSDPSGVAEVRATWSFFGTGGVVNENKVMVGGSTRTAAAGPYAYQVLPSTTQKTLLITVTATDGVGNASTTNVSLLLHSADQCFG